MLINDRHPNLMSSPFSHEQAILFLNFKGRKAVAQPLEQLSAKPMLLIYPRIYVRQLFMRFRRVKLDSLEARLRPVEQLDKRTPRGKSRLLRGNRVTIIMDV
jgi:hypothetical protein